MDHFGDSVSSLINLNAAILKICLDNRVVEDIAEVRERPPFNVVVGAFGIVRNEAFGITLTFESRLSFREGRLLISTRI